MFLFPSFYRFLLWFYQSKLLLLCILSVKHSVTFYLKRCYVNKTYVLSKSMCMLKNSLQNINYINYISGHRPGPVNIHSQYPLVSACRPWLRSTDLSFTEAKILINTLGFPIKGVMKNPPVTMELIAYECQGALATQRVVKIYVVNNPQQGGLGVTSSYNHNHNQTTCFAFIERDLLVKPITFICPLS